MQNTFLKEKPIPHLVRSMSIPVVLSMFIQSLYNIVDSIWVAQLGTDAITAVSLAFPLQNIILSVGVGMGAGGVDVFDGLAGATLGELDVARVEGLPRPVDAPRERAAADEGVHDGGRLVLERPVDELADAAQGGLADVVRRAVAGGEQRAHVLLG